MKQLLLTCILICICALSTQAQVWEPGAFSCIAGENGESTWQAIAGQPLDGTVAGNCLLYGNTEIASSLSEADKIRGIQLNKKTLSLEIGQSERLSVTFDADENANQALVWHSSDEHIASINESGEVKALQPGEAILTAITASGNYADECTLTVTRSEPEPEPEPEPIPVTDVTLNLTSATMERGESLRLVATVSPADADDTSVRWSSSDPAVASVDPNGLVQALSPGNAIITVTTNEGGLTASCEVNVNENPTAIEEVAQERIVYPRIVKERFHLNLPTSQTVYLIDAGGRIVRSFQAQVGECTVSMDGCPAGIYWVRISGQAISILKE
ncbi:Ig-like domain-containing protein [Parabacteroides sp.]|uniref:Ig-like domain-containing protein n=1 Tax=Parabacteroides sp. TaxID=1869337 RepID=UPI00257D97DC|nr:Ig-like domain-containing protein [Parabacteroides sp.]